MAGKCKLAEEMLKICNQRGRIIELSPGDPDDSPASYLESSVPFTVRLERHSCPVCLATVELDDQPLLPPQAIGFNFESIEVQEGVEPGLWQIGTSEQGGEPNLKLAADPPPWSPAKAI
jgi:hypothetical protein